MDKGKVVFREQLIRSCGHQEAFAWFENDPYRKERREKFLAGRCPSCSLKAQREHEARQQMGATSGKKVKKGQEVKRLPADATFTLSRLPDGSWSGSLCAGEVTVSGTMGGVMGLVSKLARKYLQEVGQHLHGKVTD